MDMRRGLISRTVTLEAQERAPCTCVDRCLQRDLSTPQDGDGSPSASVLSDLPCLPVVVSGGGREIESERVRDRRNEKRGAGSGDCGLTARERRRGAADTATAATC